MCLEQTKPGVDQRLRESCTVIISLARCWLRRRDTWGLIEASEPKALTF